jgi:DNA sulfur modification protein DndD
MRLLSISLLNFRQFYGSQTIHFATDPAKNVTLFHAENGVGKTTLLNAILWCFYGQRGVTAKFNSKSDILSYQAVSERASIAKVDVTFDHDGEMYTVTRRHTVSAGGRGEDSVSAYAIRDGNTEPLNAPEALISSVIPLEMAHHFFFDGEHAENFASSGQFKQVGEAIRNMLGSTVADCAIDDLSWAAKQYGEDLANHADDEQIRKKSAEVERTKVLLEKSSVAKLAEEEKITILNDQIVKIDEDLANTQEAKTLQKRRIELESRLRTVQASLAESERDTVRWIGRQAISVVATRLSKETLHFIDDEKLKGKIPSPFNEDLVTTLLSELKCLCGRPLEPASEWYNNVQNLLRKAGNAEVQSRVIKARGFLGELKANRVSAPKDLERTQKNYAQSYQESRRIQQQLDEVSVQIENIDFAGIDSKERARKGFQAQLIQTATDVGKYERDIKIYENVIDKCTRDQERLVASNSKATKLLKRKTLAERALSLVKGLLESHEAQAKAFIANEVNEILGITARRNYRFEWGAGFAFDLTYASNGRTVPRSSGENQLLSLAFIAALIKFCRSRSVTIDDPLLIPGVVAPLVLDSPFGQLDSAYKVDTSRFIANMAEQIALFVSSSQGSPDVLDSLSERVGKEYVLISENRGPRNNKQLEKLHLKGHTFETSLFGCEKDMTRIVEVS